MTSRVFGIAGSIALGLAALCVVGAPSARADITSSGSSILDQGTTLGPGTYGTVNYTFSGSTTITFDVQLNTGYVFLHTGFDPVFGFTTNLGITYGAISASCTNVGCVNAGGTWSGLPDGTGATYGVDGAGKVGGGVTNTLNGGSNWLGDRLQFSITGPAALALITAFSSNGQTHLSDYFAADICVLNAGKDACSATGIVYDGPEIVPLPPAAMLFGTALVGLGILRRRRKNETQTAVA